MEVPSPEAGTVRKVALKVGDRVSKGTLVCELETDAADAPTGEAQGTDASGSKAGSPELGSDDTQPPAAKEPAAAPQAEKPAVADEGGGSLEVTIPDIGDFDAVPVIELLVADGDRVAKEQPLLVLESDKATMEVPSPAAGTVAGLAIKVGDKVGKGTLVCRLEGVSRDKPESGATPEAVGEAPAGPELTKEPSVESAAKPAAPVAATPQAASGEPGKLPYAGPATRKFARELGVDLTEVPGSARGGRITIEDVQRFVKSAMKSGGGAAAATAAPGGGAGIPAMPAVDFSQFGPIEAKPLARIRKLSAQYLHRAWLNVPHVTQTDEVDITELEDFRKRVSDELAKAGGAKMTLLPIVMKACAVAIREYPEFASSLSPDGESLIIKKYVHIGFAADTPAGLVVPVVRDADHKSLRELASDCAALAEKARDGKLKHDEMTGGCFSISSLGGIGGGFFTPIVNAPEVAILGVSRSRVKPMWDGSSFQPRLMLPLSLSYDHRVIDGAAAARFIVFLGNLLADMRRLAL
jgi:pyruvate dehydrogenase E2 component (dihydrolipoamide acetyltransferase)